MRIAILALLTLTISADRGPSADKLPSKVDKLMAEKLKNSQAILGALATNDYDTMVKCAEKIMEISKAAEWTVYKTPLYEGHTNEFRRSAESLIKKAKQKNIDGAALAFVDMTVCCVRCHEHCREVRDTSFQPLLDQ